MHIREDFHVHSTFSDGRNTVEQNVAMATVRGLQTLGCVDHVRHDSPWLAAFVAHVRAVDRRSRVKLYCGVEAKILDENGRLDLPDDIEGIDYVVVADHQVTIGKDHLQPRRVREMLAAGELSRQRVVEGVVNGFIGAVERTERPFMAHMFSILPKVGISEDEVSDAALDALATACRKNAAIVEISERWRCPSIRTLRAMLDHEVKLVCSTDAHHAKSIGLYDHVRRTLAQLSLGSTQPMRVAV